ncbi:MAG: carboxypeptidase-like regulatory domain-containing protein [Gemmataceae bacterium]|nr:carboxypeptidase-like regulatory domain-containing protein [Gemmata sp.]MDW8198089.1 carboxypeptidase-like regulatory domain-containing protein [Gemmataceae bacterium]
MRDHLRQSLAFITLAILLSHPAAAAEPQLPDVKTFDKQVIDSLRDVHNIGADLYNKQRDYAGAYRMYQGGLLTIRPLLQHRPEAQKIIDTGLEKVELEADIARKAFLLHETIEAVRKNLKDALRTQSPSPPPKVDPPPGKEPKGPPPKVDPPKEPKKGTPETHARLSGTVSLDNQPLPGAEVVIVSLHLPRPRVFTAKTQANGSYQFAEAIPPGTYIVLVTGAAVPVKYHLTTTSPLRVELTVGANPTNLNLQK